MATDAIGQTIPSWVEDNSYELKSVATFTSNEGHLTPCSDTDFRSLWKTHYEGSIVRDGKMKDNSSYDGKFWIDPNRNYNNCLLYTSPSPRDVEESRMPSSA